MGCPGRGSMSVLSHGEMAVGAYCFSVRGRRVGGI